jgi:glycosyltransferase involved in cell wall biosynthesis
MISTSKARVVWLSMEWPQRDAHVGGVGRYTFRLAEAMKDLVDLTVVTLSGAQPLDGVQIVELPRHKSRLARFYILPVLARKAVAGLDADLVHAHGDDWALKSDTPVVRSFYGTSWSEAISSTGLRKLNHFMLYGLEKLSSTRAAASLAIAPESRDAFGCDYVVPPIIDLPKRSEAVSRIPRAVFIGSHRGRKRGWLAEKAVAEVQRRLGMAFELWVVGPESDAGSWSPDVHHCSGMSDEGVAELIGTSWLLLAPSLYEGFGIPTVEALNQRTAVVASLNPGNSYFCSLGHPSVPLVCTSSDEEYIQAVVNRVQMGPALLEAELQAADGLVQKLKDASSTERLLEIYRQAQQ